MYVLEDVYVGGGGVGEETRNLILATFFLSLYILL